MKVKLISKLYDNEDITIEEERKLFREICQKVIDNPRYYLDNLDTLYDLEFSFIYYKWGKKQ